jgi:DNA polymerase III alpha subunit (gram-positive type)
MRRIKHLLLLDTEFVSSKKGHWPFQIGFVEYEIKDGRFIRVGDFNLHIRLREGLTLNTFAKLVTGMDEETLEKVGLPIDTARYQVMSYLVKFPLEETVIIGWDPQGDKKMLNILLNSDGELFDINNFAWLDAMKIFRKYYAKSKSNNPSLKSACKYFNVATSNAHDALSDAEMTGQVLFKMIDELGAEKTMLVPQLVAV